jgi:hypothetical protein
MLRNRRCPFFAKFKHFRHHLAYQALPWYAQSAKLQAMQKCAICGADTILMVGGTPLCLKCDRSRSESDQTPAKKDSNKEGSIAGEQKRTA